MLNVLIAEDNIHISIHLSNTINTENVRCIAILNEGTKVIQVLKELEPDILILDLKMPGKNGLQILEEIEEDKNIRTKVIIYSGEMSYMSLAQKYKCVERFFSKLTVMEEIARELKIMADSISNKSLETKIIDMLLRLGFTYSLKGTRLINDCIIYSVTRNEDNIKEIYTKLSQTKGCNVHTIKSDINTAVNNMWRYADREKVSKILRINEHDKPSSKYVISMIKYYINK